MPKDLYFDIAIVGQGIAGTLMAWFLFKHGKKVLIIDDDFKGSSSKIAAGIVNPITGKNFVNSWRIHEFLPVAIEAYDDLSDFLGIKTYTKANIVRSLYTIEDENKWLSKAGGSDGSQYIVPYPDLSEFSGKVDPQFSYGELQGTFSVHIFDLMKSFRKKWVQNDSYLKDTFNYNELTILPESLQYKNYFFKEIVFCEGYKALNNPYFTEIGFAPSKGEVLILKIPGAPFKKMYKDGVFIMHQEDDLYWVGSGYEWDTLDESPTEKKFQLLSKQAKRILKIPYEVVDHRAAIRPTMHDRRPIFLVHKEIDGMYLFNGLGTKGASISPFLARQFSRYIIGKNPENLIFA